MNKHQHPPETPETQGAIDSCEVLQAEIDRLDQKACEIRTAQSSLVKKLVLLRFNIQEGSIVSHNGKKWQVSRIERYSNPFNGRPWLRGRVFLANGSLGVVGRHLYDDWVLVPSTPGLTVNCTNCGGMRPGLSVSPDQVKCVLCDKPV